MEATGFFFIVIMQKYWWTHISNFIITILIFLIHVMFFHQSMFWFSSFTVCVNGSDHPLFHTRLMLKNNTRLSRYNHTKGMGMAKPM